MLELAAPDALSWKHIMALSHPYFLVLQVGLQQLYTSVTISAPDQKLIGNLRPYEDARFCPATEFSWNLGGELISQSKLGSMYLSLNYH
jgi:hypothetical protein